MVCTLFNPDLLIPVADKVHIAKSAEDLEATIDRALTDRDVEAQLRRKSFASMNTWEHRAKSFLNYMNKANHVQVEKSY